jgi:hypothetical protein
MFSEKKKQIKKIITLEKKLLKFNLSWTSELGYPRTAAPLFNDPYFACEFQQKTLSVLNCVQAP